ncbi:hypothetical protein PISL3812_00818 [Talaromyces islandicus]|uniref:Uncharacterized protein n=1 Tax=Talaromyces islandicus TaxID=28573 RepID=A0A0U1LKC4_TALIS|nr:hypothetical protein PISL3812_00818 [Talaromyces islandicus]
MQPNKSGQGNEYLSEPKLDAFCPSLLEFPELERLCSRLTFRPDSSFLLIRATFPILVHHFTSIRGFSIISGKPGDHDGAPEFALVVRNAIEQPAYSGLIIDHVLIMFLPAQSPRDFAAIQDDRHIRTELEMKIENRVFPAEESHIPHGWPFAIVIHGVGRFGFYKYDGNKPPGSRVFKYGDFDLQLPEDWYHLVDDWNIVNKVLRHMSTAKFPLHQEPPYPSTFYVPQLFTMATMLMFSQHPAMHRQIESELPPQDPPPAPQPETPNPEQPVVSIDMTHPQGPMDFIDPRNLHPPNWRDPSRKWK